MVKSKSSPQQIVPPLLKNYPSIDAMLTLKHLGLTDYQAVLTAMQSFTRERHDLTTDEIWITEHNPIYTVGLNKKDLQLPNQTHIPICFTDRGGNITYHGPGQLVCYFLLDLRHFNLKIKNFVALLEAIIIDFLQDKKIKGERISKAPGVYVDGKKIASLGLKIARQHYCYHGFSLNIAMDLTPFTQINPCGYEGLQVTQLLDLGVTEPFDGIANDLGERFRKVLGLAYVGGNCNTFKN